MKIGDKVVPTSAYGVLASGGERYAHAYVTNIAPFQLISEDGDMRWTVTVKKEDFKVAPDNIGEYIPKPAVERLQRDGVELAPSLRYSYHRFGYLKQLETLEELLKKPIVKTFSDGAFLDPEVQFGFKVYMLERTRVEQILDKTLKPVLHTIKQQLHVLDEHTQAF